LFSPLIQLKAYLVQIRVAYSVPEEHELVPKGGTRAADLAWTKYPLYIAHLRIIALGGFKCDPSPNPYCSVYSR
jgi:hypothetical protein